MTIVVNWLVNQVHVADFGLFKRGLIEKIVVFKPFNYAKKYIFIRTTCF